MPILSGIRAWLGGKLVKAHLESQRKKLGVRVETHRDAKGRETPYLVLGEDREGTLVFLHGFGDRIDNFLVTARHLADRYRILVPAMPGFGDGWLDPEELHTAEAYGRWLGDVVADIAPPRFHLMGNSLGGATALLLAERMPERLESLVLVDCAGINPGGVRSAYDEAIEGHNLFEVRSHADYRRFQGRVMAKPMKLPPLVDAHLFEETRKKADWYARVWSDLGSVESGSFDGSKTSLVALHGITVPTLVVWGELDSLFPVAMGEHVAAGVPGAKLVVFEGIGHCPHLECPAELARTFDEFARGLRDSRHVSDRAAVR